MVASSDLPGCLPEWVRSLATPVWVSDPAGNIGYLNGHAASTLGVEAESCLGRPCYEVLAGRDEQGRLHCRANCPVLAEVLDRQQVEPFRLSLHDGGKTPR